MKNGVIIAGAGLVVGAVLGYAWLAPAPLPPATAEDAVVKSAALNAVERLDADVQRLSSEFAEMQTVSEASLAVATEADVGATSRPIFEPVAGEHDAASHPQHENATENGAATPPIGREQRERMTASLESRLASEEQDARWATGAENELADGLQNAGLENTALVAVACRSTLCKLSVNHTDQDAEDAFLGKIAYLPGMQDTEIFYVRDETPDGSTQMVLYVGRQGYDLGL